MSSSTRQLPKVLTPEQFRNLRAKATVKQHKPGEMNKTEARYSAYLDLQKRAGLILWYAFEAIKIKLAPNTFFTPDFAVVDQDLFFQIHEVKGTTKRTLSTGERVERAFTRDDALVKLKNAARLFPWRFFLVYETQRGWAREEYSGFCSE